MAPNPRESVPKPEQSPYALYECPSLCFATPKTKNVHGKIRIILTIERRTALQGWLMYRVLDSGTVDSFNVQESPQLMVDTRFDAAVLPSHSFTVLTAECLGS